MILYRYDTVFINVTLCSVDGCYWLHGGISAGSGSVSS